MKRLLAYGAVLAAGALIGVGEIPRMIEPVDPLGQQLEKRLDPSIKAGNKDDAGIKPGIDKNLDAANEREITRTIVQLVNAGISKNGFADLLATFTKEDRKRLGNGVDASPESLNMAVDFLRKTFYARYNQEFQLKEEHLKGFLTTRAGGAKNSAIVTVGVSDEKDFRKSDPNTTTDAATRRNGLPIAISPVVLNFVNEGQLQIVWRVNVPDTIDATTLREALVSQITKLDAEKLRWPDDATQAYHVITATLLSCLVDTTFASEK